MDAEKLAHQVLELLDLNELAAVRALLDEVLIRYPAQRAKLVELRDAARTHEGVWQTMRAAAEIAPLAIAISIHAHGRLLNANGDKELSSPLLGIARDAYILAEDPYGAARAQASLADSLYFVGKHSIALDEAHAAAGFFAEQGYNFEHGKCWLTIAAILTNQQDPKQARMAYETAGACFAALDTVKPDVTLARANRQISLGSLLEEQFDDFEAAAAAYQQASLYLDQLPEPAPPSAWEAHFQLHLNRAILALRLGRHTDAHRALAQAETYVQDDDIIDLLQVWLYRGYQALLLGDHAAGRRWLDRARKHAEEQESAYDQGYAAFFMALLQDTDLHSALSLLDEAANCFAAIEAQLAPALIATERARLAYAAGLEQIARDALGQARLSLAHIEAPRRLLDLDVIEVLYNPGTDLNQLRDVVKQLESFGDTVTCASVFTRLGERLEGEKQPDDAYDAYINAITALERMRGHLRLSPQSVHFMATRRHPYERAFELRVAVDPAQAFMLSERARAQVLLDELTNSGLQSLLNRDDPQLAALRPLRAALERAYARSAQTSTNTLRAGPRAESAEPQRELEEAERAYQVALDALSAAGSDEATWMRGQVADLEAIQDLLELDDSDHCLPLYE